MLSWMSVKTPCLQSVCSTPFPHRTCLNGRRTQPGARIGRLLSTSERTRYHEAFPISYIELSMKPHLFDAIRFDIKKNYLRTTRIISFHCQSCDIHVVKDGNHRLLQCAFHKRNPQLEVYEVVSQDWSACKVDMKNFCECISNNTL